MRDSGRIYSIVGEACATQPASHPMMDNEQMDPRRHALIWALQSLTLCAPLALSHTKLINC